MDLLNKNIFNLIKHRLPTKHIKFLAYNNKEINNDAKYFILKPKGRKSFIWFTYHEKELLCILILLNDNNILNENNVYYKLNNNFNNNLCYNNVLIQCIFIKNKTTNYIIIDNIFNYNNYNNIIQEYNYLHNFNSKIKLYKNTINMIYNNNINQFYIPIIDTNINTLYNKIYNIDYKIHSISIFNDTKFMGNYIFQNNILFTNNIRANFYIKSDYNADMYLMYILDNQNNYIFYDYLLIDSYKLSIFMNKIFRYIKENENLDFLEESDDEDEFENISKDKFINIEKSEIIQCIYNYKFKKWMPEKNTTENVTNKSQLLSLLNKQFNNNNNNNNNYRKNNNNNNNYSNNNQNNYRNNYKNNYNNNYSKNKYFKL